MEIIAKILVMIDDNDLKHLAYKCLETMYEDEPGILFIHNGAYLPILEPDKNKIQEFINKKVPLYGIFRDFMLRGLEDKVENVVEMVDYNEFIELIMEDFDKLISFL